MGAATKKQKEMRKMSKILFCRVAYMNNYDLDIVSDVPQNGGAYVRKTGDAGEKINFHNFWLFLRNYY